MIEKSLEELAVEKRREYKRAWNAKNRDKCREHTRRYWERKVLNELQEAITNDTDSKQ
jgi:hypothetical protein